MVFWGELRGGKQMIGVTELQRPCGRTTGGRSTSANMDYPSDIFPQVLRIFCIGSFDIYVFLTLVQYITHIAV
jgi:hypothetical protein